MKEHKIIQKLIQADARDLRFIQNESIHLVLTSPPYWILKAYNENPAQLGHIEDYELFLNELEKVWKESFRILVPGGRLIIVVGDVCLARRKYGRHRVIPLHSDIAVSCRKMGFDNLNPIIWYKIANANYEVNNGSKFLGKPFEPNGIIKNDIEFILMQRKSGGYRKPTTKQRELSKIEKSDYEKWFQQFWNIPGASTKQHPAPFPVEIAYRLIRMFSFWGDTVLDPFCGTGTTLFAAMKAQRNGIGVEIDSEYCDLALKKISKEKNDLFADIEVIFEKPEEQAKEEQLSSTDNLLYKMGNKAVAGKFADASEKHDQYLYAQGKI